MSQNTLVIADGTGADVLAALTDAFDTVASLNSGSAAPAQTYPFMWWADTTAGLLKIRNSANTGWIEVGDLASANLGLLKAFNPSYTGTFTGGTGEINIGSGQLVKDASGNVGIGTSSPTPANGTALVIYEATYPRLTLRNSTTGTASTDGYGLVGAGNDLYIENAEAGNLAFTTSNTERMRINSSGNLLVGTTSLYATNEKFNVTQSAAATGIITRLSGGPYNSTSYAMIQGVDGTTVRFYFPSNGGLYNYSANNVNLSDARTKTNIQDAGNYLEKICSIPVRTFKYIDQTDDLLNLGVIAQEVEAIAPELVDASGFGDEIPEDNLPLKGIYQTDLQYALMKCIQELKAELDATKAEVAALKGV